MPGRMSKEIAFGDGWDASANGDKRDTNPHPECKGSKLSAARFSRVMRDLWWLGWDWATVGKPKDFKEASVEQRLLN